LPTPRFDALVERDGLEIFDPIETARFELWTPGPVEPVEADADPFAFPLDSAATIQSGEVEIPKLADVFVRDEAGEYVGQYSTATDRQTFGPDRYNVELTTTPMKLYLLVESPLEIYRTGQASVVIDFGGATPVRVGARSFHQCPSGMVTVTDEVEELMRAVSLFGSALKTTSPERSFPTMRGHPPRIERGEDFRVSRGLGRAQTGVTLVVSEKRRAVFATASLAYYLGAELVAGHTPRLIAGGVDHELPRPATDLGWSREMDDFEREVTRLLQQVFFLDCLTRTEGLYQFDLHEREALDLGLDFAYLYDQSIPTQLDAYLDVPFEEIQPHLPTWNLLVDFVPTVENAGLLPYVVNDLALVRCTPPPEHRTLRPEDDQAMEYMDDQQRQAYREMQEKPGGDDPEVHDMSFAGQPFAPWPAPAVEHAYAGDGYPEGANKLSMEGFENQRDVPRTDESSIHVQVVVNDPELVDVGLVHSVYNDRNLIDVEVRTHEKPTRRELLDILQSPADFLHYYGHVTEDGIEYYDDPEGDGLPSENGLLPPRHVREVGPKAFFLHSCDDYADAEWLIRRGAFGGVASVTEPNGIRKGDDALVMGRWMARLLNQGFTLRSAVEVVEQAFPNQMEYTILGDGGISLVQAESRKPYLANIESRSENNYRARIKTFPVQHRGIGGNWRANLDKYKTNYIVPKELPTIELSRSELKGYLDSQLMPVELDEKYVWSDVFYPDRHL
jgi:hypothetical protein